MSKRLVKIGGSAALPNGQVVEFIIKRNGQQMPCDGNQVKTLLIVGLAYEGNFLIHDEMCFGNKLSFFDNHLTKTWGTIANRDDDSIKGCRIVHQTFITDTWIEGFDQAESYFDKEIEALELLIVERKLAMMQAEE